MVPMTVQEMAAAGLLKAGVKVRCTGPSDSVYTEGLEYEAKDCASVYDNLHREGEYSSSCNTTSSRFVLVDPPEDATAVVSDGGSSSYYDLPKDATELNDLIEAKGMSFARANIFKACFRMGEKAGTDAIYDINKIIYFAERMRGMVEKGHKV